MFNKTELRKIMGEKGHYYFVGDKYGERYYDARPFSCGWAAVQCVKDGTWQYINDSFIVRLGFYDEAHDYKINKAIVRIGKKYAIRDEKGNESIDKYDFAQDYEFHHTYEFEDGESKHTIYVYYSRVEIDKHPYFRDQEGNLRSPQSLLLLPFAKVNELFSKRYAGEITKSELSEKLQDITTKTIEDLNNNLGKDESLTSIEDVERLTGFYYGFLKNSHRLLKSKIEVKKCLENVLGPKVKREELNSLENALGIKD